MQQDGDIVNGLLSCYIMNTGSLLYDTCDVTFSLICLFPISSSMDRKLDKLGEQSPMQA